MTKLDNVMKEISEDTETSPETKNDETQVNPSPVEEKAPEVPQNSNKDDSEGKINYDSPEKSVEPKNTEKTDKSQFTDMEKAEYSFRKQLGKQKQKYEQMLADQQKRFDDMQSRLDRLENPDKYKSKLRNDFENDDQYIDYIVQQRMQKILAEQDEKNAKIQAQNEEDERNQAVINDNISNCFKTEAEQKEYYSVVKNAFDHGLEALMDKEKMVANYIMQSPNGPRILYELAKDPNKVKQVYSQMDPQSRFFELKMLEREIMTKPAIEKAATPINNGTVSIPASSPNLAKPVGTPGLAKGNTKEIFDSPEDLRNFIRRR